MKQLWAEFKAFIMRGNVIDLAIAVVIGAAFKAIVDSLVTDIITPLIGTLIGKESFTKLTFKLGKGVIAYGKFITAIVNFVIIAAAVFIMIKTFEQLRRLRGNDAPDPEVEPAPNDEVVLLTQIRDLLQERAQ